MAEIVDCKYRAFLSYAHADASWAKWLHGRLEGYRIDNDLVGRVTPIGPVPKQLRPIFRDRDEFTGGHSLGDATVAAIDASACLLVICSSVSATRPIVGEEVRLFRSRHPDRPVIPVIVDGHAPDNFPPALRYEITADGVVSDRPITILAPDLRDQGDGRELGLAKVVAGLTGVGSDDIFRRGERARRLAARFRNAVIVVLAALAVAAAASGAYAWYQLKRNEAFLDATLGQFTGLVDRAVKAGEAYSMPLTATRGFLEQAEGILGVMSRFGRETAQFNFRKAVMLSAFADNYREAGQTADRQRRIEEAQVLLARLVRDDPANNDYAFQKSLLHGKSAQLYSTVGDPVAAMREARARHEIAARLAAAASDNVTWQSELVSAHEGIAYILNSQNDILGALREFSAGFAIAERLARENPDNAVLQRNLSLSYGNIAGVKTLKLETSAALDDFRAALAIQDKLAKAEPGNASRQYDLSTTYTQIGLVLSTSDPKEALKSYEAANAILAGLVKADPGNASWQSSLAMSETTMSALHLALGDTEAALARTTTARAIWDRMAKADPRNTNVSSVLGMSDSQLGALLEKQGKTDEALALYRGVIARLDRQLATDPKDSATLFLAYTTHSSMAELLTKQGQHAGAMASYDANRKFAELMLDQDSTSKLWAGNLASMQANIAETLHAQKLTKEAIASYRTSIATRERAAAAHNGDVELQAPISSAYISIGDLLADQHEPDAAVQSYQAARDFALRLAEASPDSGDRQAEAAGALSKLCTFGVPENYSRVDLQACDRDLVLLRSAVPRFPDKAVLKTLLASIESLLPALQMGVAKKEGRYADAYGLAQIIAERTEADEVKVDGKAGKDTADALQQLCYNALLARRYDDALKACERAHALAPDDLDIESNRAHALMFTGRRRDARALYLAHMDKIMPDSSKSWQVVIAEDFAELRKAGLANSLMLEVEAAFGRSKPR